MKRTGVLTILVCLLVTANFALADTIRGIDIDFVPIGNAGNAADTGGTPGRGAVSYNYRIGMYDVTNAQWNAFTDAAGAPTGNDGGYAQSAFYPTAQQTDSVSWYEAAQFCNYLTSGDKSRGAYLFSGTHADPGDFLGINRDAAILAFGTVYVIPNEDEWYKAAYFKPNGSGYSLYVDGTDISPGPFKLFGAIDQNGTYDMAGNWEWNENILESGSCGLRGGSYYDSAIDYSASPYRSFRSLDAEGHTVGFRIVEIPEPASAMIIMLGSAWIAVKRKR